MILLTDGVDEPIIIALDDDSEIEIETIELKGQNTKVVVSTNEQISVTHKLIRHKASE